jgi:predicted AAA+ superfamily ATPase
LLYNLIEYLDVVNFTYRIGRFSRDVELSGFTDKKIYFVDNGMVRALSFSFQKDFGELFENTVFLWLHRQTPFQRGLLYFKGKKLPASCYCCLLQK